MKYIQLIAFLFLISCERYTKKEIKDLEFYYISNVEIRITKYNQLTDKIIKINNANISIIKAPLTKLLDKIKSESFLERTQDDYTEIEYNFNEIIPLRCSIFIYLKGSNEYYYISHDQNILRKIQLEGKTFFLHTNYSKPIYYNYNDLNQEIERFMLEVMPLISEGKIQIQNQF